MKKLFLMGALTLTAMTANATAVIPKFDIFTCQIDKAAISSWYSLEAAALNQFNALTTPLTLKLQQANIGNTAGLSTHYTFAVRAYDSSGKSLKFAERTLEQLAVTYSENTISVGYAPYDTSRTDAQPFTMLVQAAADGKTAKGFISFVPLHTMQDQPFAVAQVACEMGRKPAEGISLSAADFAALPAPTQFEVFHDLDRVGQVVSRTQTPPSGDIMAKAQKSISTFLAARALPEFKGDANRVLVPVTGDHCGDVKVGSIAALYDSANYELIRRGNAAAAKPIGYRLGNVRCSLPAQSYNERYRDTDPFTLRNQNWNAESIYMPVSGDISPDLFR